jgi:hypothetical protein
VSEELINAVLAKATAEAGVREATGRNDGAKVEAYLASVGLGKGHPWCAAFVQWALKEGGVPQGVWTPDNRAYCPSIYSWARLRGVLHKAPQRGDVFLYMENGWALHTGFVIEVTHNGTRFSTIEGNTNPGGSAEGDGVYERSRPHNGKYVFVRWADLLPEAAPTVKPTFALWVNGAKALDMEVKAGRSYVKLEDFAEALGLTLSWDADAHKPRLGGKVVTGDVEYRSGRSWGKVNELLKGLGRAYQVDQAGRRVIVS